MIIHNLLAWSSILLLSIELSPIHSSELSSLKRLPRQIIRTPKKTAYTRPANDEDVRAYSDTSNGRNDASSTGASNNPTVRNPVATALTTIVGQGMRMGMNLLGQFFGFNGGSPNIADAGSTLFPGLGGSGGGGSSFSSGNGRPLQIPQSSPTISRPGGSSSNNVNRPRPTSSYNRPPRPTSSYNRPTYGGVTQLSYANNPISTGNTYGGSYSPVVPTYVAPQYGSQIAVQQQPWYYYQPSYGYYPSQYSPVAPTSYIAPSYSPSYSVASPVAQYSPPNYYPLHRPLRSLYYYKI